MSAYARLAAASALAVSFTLAALPAIAADLYEPPYDEYGEGPPPPQRDRYQDVPDDFEPPYPPRRAEAGCIPRELARDRLNDAGWYDFHGLEPRGEVVLVQARRPSGRLFDLTIDRCSGRIVDAKPVFGGGGRYYGNAGGWRPYAWGQRRDWRPY